MIFKNQNYLYVIYQTPPFITKNRIMIIKNNKKKGQYFHYKINGKVEKIFIGGEQEVDIQALTDAHQILSNTYERRLRHIEDRFGKNVKTAFEVPGDPDFIAYVITASTSLSGTITPSGAVHVAEGENQIFYMSPTAVPFSISATTMGSSGGTMSPTGTAIVPNSNYYLKTLTVDGGASAFTGIASATTTYTFTNVFSAHTISATFALSAKTNTISIIPSSNYYLKVFTENGANKLGSVVGSVSGTCSYVSSVVSANMAINATFKPFGQ